MVHYKTARMFLWLTCALGLPSVFMHNVGRAQEFVPFSMARRSMAGKPTRSPNRFPWSMAR